MYSSFLFTLDQLSISLFIISALYFFSLNLNGFLSRIRAWVKSYLWYSTYQPSSALILSLLIIHFANNIQVLKICMIWLPLCPIWWEINKFVFSLIKSGIIRCLICFSFIIISVVSFSKWYVDQSYTLWLFTIYFVWDWCKIFSIKQKHI